MKLSSTELHYAIAKIKRDPRFTFIVSTVLGLTIALLIIALKLNYLLFVEPLPYDNQDRLYRVDLHSFSKGELVSIGHSQPSAELIYNEAKDFNKTALIYQGEQLLYKDDGATVVRASFVTPELFQMTNATLRLGRLFNENEGLNSNQKVAILSYDTWKNDFNSDEDIVGKSIAVRNETFKVVGVLSRDYVEPEVSKDRTKTAVWLTWDLNPDPVRSRMRWVAVWHHVHVLAELTPGIQKELPENMLAQMIAPHKNSDARGQFIAREAEHQVHMVPLNEAIIGDTKKLSTLLTTVITILLAIAITIISILFLSRIMEKQRDMAIHAAIGANRNHLFKSTFSENSAIMFITWIVSIICCLVLIESVVHNDIAAQYFPKTSELNFDLYSALLSLIICLSLALFFTVFCINKIKYEQLSSQLQSSGKGTSQQISRRTQHILLSVLTGLSFILLTISAQSFYTSYKIIDQELGVETDNLYHIKLRARDRFPIPERKALLDFVVRNLEELPSIESVSHFPFPQTIRKHRWPLSKDSSFEEFHYVAQMGTDENYLPTSQIPLLAGRNFTTAEIQNEANVVIISETTAKYIDPEGDALGKVIHSNQIRRTVPQRVIGIVGDIKIPYRDKVMQHMTTYFPSITYFLGISFRVKQGQEINVQDINRIIQQADPRLFLQQFIDVKQHHKELMKADIFGAIVSGSLAIIAVLLSIFGIHGITSYNVKVRQNELGIRMAIGAAPVHVYSLLLKEVSLAIISGLVFAGILGISLTYFSVDYMNGKLVFELFAVGASVLIVTLATLVGTGTSLASIVSKWPTQSLRSEN